MKRQCTKRRPKRVLRRFRADIQDFAAHFVKIRNQRHLAGYDPFEYYKRSPVSQLIAETQVAIDQFNQADRKDRVAFVVFVAFRLRPN